MLLITHNMLEIWSNIIIPANNQYYNDVLCSIKISTVIGTFMLIKIFYWAELEPNFEPFAVVFEPLVSTYNIVNT